LVTLALGGLEGLVHQHGGLVVHVVGGGLRKLTHSLTHSLKPPGFNP
jgi:hypothetical protein